MPKTTTPEQYHRLAEKRGLIWLGPEVKNANTKTRWQCKLGHKPWETKYGAIQQGHGCPDCGREKVAGKQRLRPDSYHGLAEKRGFKWLGPWPPNANSNTRWLCASGHSWSATYGKIYSGRGCPACSGRLGNSPKTPLVLQAHVEKPVNTVALEPYATVIQLDHRKAVPSDYRKLATARELIWLGPEVKSISSATSWKCRQRHVWEASFASINRGHGCPRCGDERKRAKMALGNDDYHQLAKELELCWLGSVAKNTRTKTVWQCKEQHIWEASFSQVKRHACPICSREAAPGKRRLSAREYNSLATKLDIKWLGPEVRSAQHRTRWQCKLGHIWQAPYCRIQDGELCKVCATERSRKTALVEASFFEAVAAKRGLRWCGPAVSTKGAPTFWLCPNNHKWEAPATKIQQGWGCPTCGGTRRPKRRARLRAEDYEQLAADRAFEWLGPSVSNNQLRTGWKCALGHTWRASYAHISQARGCPTCGIASSARTRKKKSEDYEKLATERGISWLGVEPINHKSKTFWQCPNGHQWEATYSHIRAGRNCPYCSKERVANSQRKQANDYVELAASKMLTWCGPAVTNRHNKTWWQCGNGHRWEATYANIYAGRSCPVCTTSRLAAEKRLPPRAYHELADSLGWKWLGPEVERTTSKTQWCCQKGHIFETAYAWIKGGNRCASCANMIQGKRYSAQQLELAKTLGLDEGSLNQQMGGRAVDVLLYLDSIPICLEYDSWYWHGPREEDDELRNKQILATGARLICIRSNARVPSKDRLDKSIHSALNGRRFAIITLPDWGRGPTFADIRSSFTKRKQKKT